jgi:hypothetical protein
MDKKRLEKIRSIYRTINEENEMELNIQKLIKDRVKYLPSELREYFIQRSLDEFQKIKNNPFDENDIFKTLYLAHLVGAFVVYSNINNTSFRSSFV